MRRDTAANPDGETHPATQPTMTPEPTTTTDSGTDREFVGQCDWCDDDVYAHTDDPSGDVITWRTHTGGVHTFCTLYHQLQWFDSRTGETAAVDEASPTDG